MTNNEAIETLYKWAKKYESLKQLDEEITHLEEAKQQLSLCYFSIPVSSSSFTTTYCPEFYTLGDYIYSLTYQTTDSSNIFKVVEIDD